MSEKSESKHEEMELRRGPWTLEEDSLLIHYIACHGEGRWNLLARCSGLKRTGKSCRLRWLNYLKPDVKRGNLSPEEQLLILDLHSKWGNRWSRIAQHLPGRTDNEIKNYWRTRVQKQARQLNIDVNSSMFRDAVRFYWMPRLVEKVGSSQFMHSLYPNISATAPPAAPPPPPPASVVPIMESSYHCSRYYQLSGSNSSSPSVSQLPELSQLPWSSPDELDGPTSNQFLNDQIINNDYNMGEWDMGSASSYSASDCARKGNNCIDSLPDGLWSMIEAYMSGFDGDNQN